MVTVDDRGCGGRERPRLLARTRRPATTEQAEPPDDRPAAESGPRPASRRRGDPPRGARRTATAATARTFGRLGTVADAEPRNHRYLVRLPIGIFAGWITLATVVASTQAVYALGLRVAATLDVGLSVALVAVAGLIAAGVTWRLPYTAAYTITTAWGLTAAVVHAGPLQPQVTVTGATAVLLISAVGVARYRLRLRRLPDTGPR